MKLFYTLSIIILTLPTVLFAQDSVYSPLVDLSNAGRGNQVQTFEQYINFLYGMSIAVAALLAVIKIVIAGAKYMLSDVINTKGEALSDIQGAILGLLLILSAVIILELINPQLVEKEIVFPAFQSERGDVLPPAVQTIGGGQTTEEVANELFEGLSECTKKNQQPGPSGSKLVYVINASSCDDAATEIAAFEKNCQEKKGTFVKAKTVANQAVCGLPIDGVAEASEYAKSAESLPVSGIWGVARVSQEFISTNGTVVTVDVTGACRKVMESVSEDLRRAEMDSCTRQFESRLDDECDGVAFLLGSFGNYGKYNGDNLSAISCQTPKRKSAITDLKEAFDKYKTADPSREFVTFGNLTASEEEEICETHAGGEFFDENGSNNTCVFY